MKECGISENIQRILDAMRIPVMLCDENGTEIYQNRLWIGMRKTLDAHRKTLSQGIRDAMSRMTEVSTQTEDFILAINPFLRDGKAYVMCQLVMETGEDALLRRLDDATEQNDSYRQRLSNFGERNYIANSSQMLRIFTKAKQVAVYPTSIMILGETGVGKEVLSSFVHNNSDRSDKPFIKINCSAIPEPLMESELFGYEAGAFTGARNKGKSGLFELANHGTILLDEIGDMALPMQAKLLRVIQESEIRRVGGSKAIPIDVRIISATSRDLEAMVTEGTFLDALYYRLNVVELQIPPLRQRREDILPLAEYYLQFFCEKYKFKREFSQATRECFNQYDWPGNVRELRNTVENLAVSAVGQIIDSEDLPARLRKKGEHPGEEKSLYLAAGGSMKQAVEELQKQMIENALRQQGSLRKAAVVLDMDPTTLHRLAKKLQIET